MEDPHVSTFDANDFAVFQAVANQLAGRVEERLFDETRQRLEELETVNRISIALRAAQTPEEMLPLLAWETQNALNVAAVTILAL